jgi:two-component system, OmpR family, sensor kinase
MRRALSLRARLVLGVIVVSAIGLAAADVATYASLRSFLVERTDESLEESQHGFERGFHGPRCRPPRGASAGDVFQLRAPDGDVVCSFQMTSFGDRPPSPPELPTEIGLGKFAGGPPRTVSFTVPAKDGDGRYRVRASTDPETGATIVAATPLDDVDATLRRLLLIMLLVTVAVLAALGALGLWVVRLGLRPLDAIGATAAGIAGGDLSRRVERAEPHTEVGRLGLALNAMLGQIETAFNARAASEQKLRRFVADASHELQTPLASSRTELEVALAHPEQLETEATLRDLLAANRRMEDLVRNLLFLAREDGRPPPAPALVDLDDVVLAESTRLLDNAHRHATAAVRVELTSDDGEVRLVVTDDGPGIAARDRDRVFDRFTRLDDARAADGGGAGLGLAIAREIVVRHGGTIVVEDSPVGARVVVRLVPA